MGPLVTHVKRVAPVVAAVVSRQGRTGEPSERVEAGLEQAELIALGVGKNVP